MAPRSSGELVHFTFHLPAPDRSIDGVDQLAATFEAALLQDARGSVVFGQRVGPHPPHASVREGLRNEQLRCLGRVPATRIAGRDSIRYFDDSIGIRRPIETA